MCLSDASNLHAKRYNDVVCHLIQKANNEIQYGGEKYLSWEGLVDQNTRGSHFILTFLSIWVYRLKIFNQCCAVHGSALHNLNTVLIVEHRVGYISVDHSYQIQSIL